MTAAPTAADRIEADVVVVGGGSAGCVVARRLADADPGLQVVLIEAGAGRSRAWAEIPGMTVRPPLRPLSSAEMARIRQEVAETPYELAVA